LELVFPSVHSIGSLNFGNFQPWREIYSSPL
jgi:hypothetical protein